MWSWSENAQTQRINWIDQNQYWTLIALVCSNLKIINTPVCAVIIYDWNKLISSWNDWILQHWRQTKQGSTSMSYLCLEIFFQYIFQYFTVFKVTGEKWLKLVLNERNYLSCPDCLRPSERSWSCFVLVPVGGANEKFSTFSPIHEVICQFWSVWDVSSKLRLWCVGDRTNNDDPPPPLCFPGVHGMPVIGQWSANDQPVISQWSANDRPVISQWSASDRPVISRWSTPPHGPLPLWDWLIFAVMKGSSMHTT